MATPLARSGVVGTVVVRLAVAVMDEAQGVGFLEALGAKKIRVKGNGWIEACCPLAIWTHAKHRDTTPSFGLSVVPGGRSYYSCFACQSGSAEELLHTVELWSKDTAQSYQFAVCHSILADEVQLMPLPEYGSVPDNLTFEPWPDYWIESFQGATWQDYAYAYLEQRGVTPTDAQVYDLRWDPKRSMIVFPYRSAFGYLAGARGRSILPGVEGPKKHYDYTWQGRNNCRLVWYGEPALQLPGPVVIVEGQFDLIRTTKAYPKTLANLTAKPSWEKMTKLADCPRVIQIPDRDEAGAQSTAIYAKYCNQLHIPYTTLWLDDGVDDPAECAVEYLRDRIQALL